MRQFLCRRGKDAHIVRFKIPNGEDSAPRLAAFQKNRILGAGFQFLQIRQEG